MTRLYSVLVCCGVMVFGCMQAACTSPGKLVREKQPDRRAIALKGCIKGKLIKEDDKSPLSYVPVLTEPSTSLTVSQKDGSFEICHRRVGGKSNQVSKRFPIPPGKYVLVVKKENYKTKRLAFVYKGNWLNLGEVQLRDQRVNLPDNVRQKQPNPDGDADRDTGIIGPGPKEG